MVRKTEFLLIFFILMFDEILLEFDITGSIVFFDMKHELFYEYEQDLENETIVYKYIFYCASLESNKNKYEIISKEQFRNELCNGIRDRNVSCDISWIKNNTSTLSARKGVTQSRPNEWVRAQGVPLVHQMTYRLLFPPRIRLKRYIGLKEKYLM